jgi:hypothetical protein
MLNARSRVKTLERRHMADMAFKAARNRRLRKEAQAKRAAALKAAEAVQRE